MEANEVRKETCFAETQESHTFLEIGRLAQLLDPFLIAMGKSRAV